MTRKTLKSFQLGEMLGVGTVGTIHRAVDRVSRREVALKILQTAVSQDPTIRLRFEREIEVLHKLNHPNVVACYDHGLDNKAAKEFMLQTWRVLCPGMSFATAS